MPTIGLNHYNLRAAPELLAELKEFYCEVVGLELGKRMPAMSSGYWLYAGGQDILHLSEAKQGKYVSPTWLARLIMSLSLVPNARKLNRA